MPRRWLRSRERGGLWQAGKTPLVHTEVVPQTQTLRTGWSSTCCGDGQRPTASIPSCRLNLRLLSLSPSAVKARRSLCGPPLRQQLLVRRVLKQVPVHAIRSCDGQSRW